MIERFVKPRIGFAALLGVLGMFAFGAAVAQADDVITTSFNGTTSNLGDNQGGHDDSVGPYFTFTEGTTCSANDGISPVTSAEDTNTRGCFHFSGSLPATTDGCVFSDAMDAGETTTCSGTIVSDGWYQNQICGTGVVYGWATITGSPAAESPINFDYSISFSGGQGTMTIGDTDTDSSPSDDGHGDGPGLGATGWGVVDISGIPTGTACATDTATRFIVTGTATLNMPDSPSNA